ncbi:MAG TPA: ATP-binding protein [Anaeromyxobacter sp.]|nr:ATP-binding protein [Anaeromyxobacter sp.]
MTRTRAKRDVERRGHAHRLSTRRRLIVAFSGILVVFLAALALQLAALRRMEATFEEMKEHEDQMRLVLKLEDAVRDEYAHEEQVLRGDAAALRDYEAARGRALELGRRLDRALDEPETIALLREIRAARAELDARFDAARAAPARGGDPAAELDPSHRLVSRIEHDVDRIFARLQEVGSSYRAQLASLEAAALRWTAALLLGMPLLVAGIVAHLSRSVTRPLARLSAGAAAVASGDLDGRIDVDTPDEFGSLAAEFNRMTAALKHHQERLVEAEKLAGVGRLAAAVAHEINNPLQVIIGYLSFNRGVRDRRLAEQLAAAEAEALRCKGIVDGLLELARPPLVPARVDLRALCEDAAAGVRAAVQARAARLSVDGVGLARGDGPKLRQVVFNLMKNAVEAAGPAGDVDVRIGLRGEEHVEVAVRDSGPGIPAEAKNRLFEPFFSTKSSGTGLGLAVSRAIALAHGGDIDVRNGEPAGAVFTLRLPRAGSGGELT